MTSKPIFNLLKIFESPFSSPSPSVSFSFFSSSSIFLFFYVFRGGEAFLIHQDNVILNLPQIFHYRYGNEIAKLQQTSWHFPRLCCKDCSVPNWFASQIVCIDIPVMEQEGHVFQQEWCSHLIARSPDSLLRETRVSLELVFNLPNNKLCGGAKHPYKGLFHKYSWTMTRNRMVPPKKSASIFHSATQICHVKWEIQHIIGWSSLCFFPPKLSLAIWVILAFILLLAQQQKPLSKYTPPPTYSKSIGNHLTTWTLTNLKFPFHPSTNRRGGMCLCLQVFHMG